MNSNNYSLKNDTVITADEIRQILEKYRIGKKPLAKLLGWGETTIIRYMEGDIPTSEYSNKLKTLLDNPGYYYELLMRRKHCLTNVAFKKTKKAVLARIMASKIYVAAYYIINKTNAEICASYIQFLLYYIQAFSLSLYDKEIFQEDYKINKEGKPFPQLYKTMKRCGISTLEIGEEFLKEDERRLIDEVLNAFSWFGPRALHAIMLYERSMLKISRDRYNNKIVSKECLKDYFKEICKEYDINGVDDIKKYPDQCITIVYQAN